MAEAIAPPQPSLLDQAGDVIGGFLNKFKGIPVDDGSRTVQGAVAPSTAPVPSVVAAPVAKQVVTGTTLAPMVTEKDRAAAEAAKADGSQKALLQAAAQADTIYVQEIQVICQPSTSARD
jgi:hypothetical protein